MLSAMHKKRVDFGLNSYSRVSYPMLPRQNFYDLVKYELYRSL